MTIYSRNLPENKSNWTKDFIYGGLLHSLKIRSVIKVTGVTIIKTQLEQIFHIKCSSILLYHCFRYIYVAIPLTAIRKAKVPMAKRKCKKWKCQWRKSPTLSISSGFASLCMLTERCAVRDETDYKWIHVFKMKVLKQK